MRHRTERGDVGDSGPDSVVSLSGMLVADRDTAIKLEWKSQMRLD